MCFKQCRKDIYLAVSYWEVKSSGSGVFSHFVDAFLKLNSLNIKYLSTSKCSFICDLQMRAKKITGN